MFTDVLAVTPHIIKVRRHTDRIVMSAREIAEFSWTTFRPVFDEIRL